MTKNVFNKCVICCKNIKWKVFSVFFALLITFYVGYNSSKHFAKQERLSLQEKLAANQEKYKKALFTLRKKTAHLESVYKQKTFSNEMIKHKVLRDANIACQKEIVIIKENYKKAACAICKSKKKDK